MSTLFHELLFYQPLIFLILSTQGLGSTGSEKREKGVKKALFHECSRNLNVQIKMNVQILFLSPQEKHYGLFCDVVWMS